MDLKRKHGFNQDKLLVLKGGMYGWQDAGMPTVKAVDELKRRAPALYAQHCTTCHQAGGGGVSGVVPPLVGSSTLADPSGRSLVKLMLQGKATGRYQTQMPGFWRLSDEEVAVIASHVRKQFGPPGAKFELGATIPVVVRAELGATLPMRAVPLPSAAATAPASLAPPPVDASASPMRPAPRP